MFDYLKEWIEALGSNKYLHGDKITMPDLMVYGVLKSISGLKTFDDIIQKGCGEMVFFENNMWNGILHSTANFSLKWLGWEGWAGGVVVV